MSKTVKASDFLSRMNVETDASPAAPPAQAAVLTGRGGGSRAGLKHIGGYLDGGTVEKIALLRARLALDNSQLIKLAIERLYAAESAKRKFGEA